MALCNGLLWIALVNCSDAIFLRGGLTRCGAVCFVSTAFHGFECHVSIDTDTRANYKCGHFGWIWPKTVPKDYPKAD